MLWCLKVVVLFALCALAGAETTEQEIELRPAADLQHVELAQGNFICRFHYKVQGGTYEKWTMAIDSSEDKRDYTCSVSRAFSYLYFNEFSAEIINGIPEYAEGLKEEEYIVDKKKGVVKYNPSHFKHKLSKLVIYARAPHGEL